VKGRLYENEGAARDSALYTLRMSLATICRMLAPITPFFSEECYSYLGAGSVHAAGWPDISFTDADADRKGALLSEVVSEVRRFKHDNGMALNAPLGSVFVYTAEEIDDAGDASCALNATVTWSTEEPQLERVISDVDFSMAVIGPKLRNKARGFMDAVRTLSEDDLSSGVSHVAVDGEDIAVPEGAYELVYAYRVAGEEVDVLTLDDGVIVTVLRTA